MRGHLTSQQPLFHPCIPAHGQWHDFSPSISNRHPLRCSYEKNHYPFTRYNAYPCRFLLRLTQGRVAEIDILTADGKPLASAPEFSTDLFVVEVTYSDGSAKMLDADGLVTPVYDEESDDTTTWNGMVEASYGGMTVQKTFVLEEILAPVYPNDGEGPITYKELVSLSIYQISPATDGEPFDPSLFRIQAEYAGGPSEDLIQAGL